MMNEENWLNLLLDVSFSTRRSRRIWGTLKIRENDPYSLEIDFLCDKKKLGQIIDRCYRIHGNTETAIMLDYIKDMGYHYSTIAAITISISDMEIPEAKDCNHR